MKLIGIFATIFIGAVLFIRIIMVKGKQVEILNRPAAVSLTECFGNTLATALRGGKADRNRDKSENLPIDNS